MLSTTASSTDELAALVRRYRVCWEVWPEFFTLNGEKRQVGFTLELSGCPEPEDARPVLDWSVCARVFAALHRIAEAILLREKRPTGYAIDPYDQAFHFSRLRQDRPDVNVCIHLYHRQGFEQPVDACEVRCLEEMETRLAELGACERQWASSTKATREVA
jgi:hypothetical protein